MIAEAGVDDFVKSQGDLSSGEARTRKTGYLSLAADSAILQLWMPYDRSNTPWIIRRHGEPFRTGLPDAESKGGVGL